MNTVYFDTPGLLDMRAVTTFGLSVKENENPIGYFGTGLKYAIAILLRNGADLTISNSSGDVYSFSVNKDTFRNVEFNALAMHSSMRDVELPFTTELGKNWKMWMAFREMYCNTQDARAEHEPLGPAALLGRVPVEEVKEKEDRDGARQLDATRAAVGEGRGARLARILPPSDREVLSKRPYWRG